MAFLECHMSKAKHTSLFTQHLEYLYSVDGTTYHLFSHSDIFLVLKLLKKKMLFQAVLSDIKSKGFILTQPLQPTFRVQFAVVFS